jgi:hypothetical protein
VSSATCLRLEAAMPEQNPPVEGYDPEILDAILEA